MSGVGGRALVTDASHMACVERWFDRVGKGLPVVAFIDATETAFDAICRRALQALGDITLLAIAERVVLHAADEMPVLSALRVEPKGLDTRELRARAHQLDRTRLTQALCALLVELLAVLDRLTAGVLTGPLHDELASVGADHMRKEPFLEAAGPERPLRGKPLRLRVRKKS